MVTLEAQYACIRAKLFCWNTYVLNIPSALFYSNIIIDLGGMKGINSKQQRGRDDPAGEEKPANEETSIRE